MQKGRLMEDPCHKHHPGSSDHSEEEFQCHLWPPWQQDPHQTSSSFCSGSASPAFLLIPPIFLLLRITLLLKSDFSFSCLTLKTLTSSKTLPTLQQP